MVRMWNARSYLKGLKTNLKSSQRAPVFLLPRLFPSLRVLCPEPSICPSLSSILPCHHTTQGLQDSWHHSCHWPESAAQRPDRATTLKWRLTTNTGWIYIYSFVDSRSKKKNNKQTKKIPFSYHQIYGGFCSFQTSTQKICKNMYTYGWFVLF